jgi:transposase-like protein
VIESSEVLMRVARKVRDAEEAAALLDAVEASGMTRAAWARRHGIDARSLNAWRLNLGRQEPATQPLRLVELVSSSTTTAAPMVLRCGPFSMELAQGVDDDLLLRVLRAMASC